MKYYASFPVTAKAFFSNRAINYGDGLFETMLVTNGKIPLWDLHFKRLQEGLKRMGISVVSNQLIYSKIMSLIESNQAYVAKLVVFRDDEKRGYASQSCQPHFFITIHAYENVPMDTYLTVSSVTLSKQKALAGIKHLNRLEQVMAGHELSSTAYSDAIMLDSKNHVVETINKNIVLIKGKKLYTPKLNHCGVYGVALRWLESQGYKLKWKKIEFDSMQKYDGMMVCNSVQGFNAIRNIDDKIKFNHHLPIIKEIKRKWEIGK